MHDRLDKSRSALAEARLKREFEARKQRIIVLLGMFSRYVGMGIFNYPKLNLKFYYGRFIVQLNIQNTSL